MRLIQYKTQSGSRGVGAVNETTGRVLSVEGAESVYELAMAAIQAGHTLEQEIKNRGFGEPVDYDALIKEKRLLPPLDHPEPTRFWITGTGLTHTGSAQARDKMHDLQHGEDKDLTDSMKIFHMGLKGGKPKDGEIGVQPEWFYKGVGTCVVPPEADIPSPSFALAGGEEAEIVGLYVIGPDGNPWRIGYALGNEFSDHVTEAQNYLYLAHSKLRACSIGPELVMGQLPDHVEGEVRVMRNGAPLWRGEFLSGEGNMSHSVRNLEHYHFRYDMFRRPGDLHAYFFGAAILSCANGVKTQSGDVFEIDVPSFGRVLRNPMRVQAEKPFTMRHL